MIEMPDRLTQLLVEVLAQGAADSESQALGMRERVHVEVFDSSADARAAQHRRAYYVIEQGRIVSMESSPAEED